MSPREIAWITIALLWGLFLLEFQAPLALGLLGAFLAALLLLLDQMRMDRAGLLLLLNFVYWLGSGFLVGSISPLDVISMTFINGEGRVFVTYLPLLMFSVAPVVERNVLVLHKTLVSLAVASLFFYLVWLPTKLAILSEGASGSYVAFLTSHTGGGTFFAVLSAFLALYGYESHRPRTLALGLAMVLPVLASASREALMSLCVVLVWYLIKIQKWRSMVLSAGLAAMIVAAMPFAAPHTWSRTAGLFSWSVVESAVVTAETTTWEPGDGDIDYLGKQVNVLSRVVFWSYAIRRFLESPFVGIGYGRYNDPDLEMSGIPGLVYVATGGKKALGVGHAHNSYLHILAESGLIGLALMLGLWGMLYSRLRRAARRYARLKDAHALFMAGQGLVVFALVAAIPGHALAAPSAGLPVLTIVGLALAYKRFLDRNIIVGAPRALVDSRPELPEATTEA